MNYTAQKIPLHEKIGYALGDAASNLVWRGALAFLGVFYTDTFGISAAAAGLLILIVRLSDGVTDVMMGMVADRTNTPQGKFRPWILWSTPVLAVFMVLSFSTPDLSPTGKLVYAYFTYIGLTLAYTVSNVPYSALMGVMTSSETERTNLSGFRFAGAFLGGLLITGFLPDLVALLGQGSSQQGYQYSMFIFAGILVVMFLITYFTTKERVKPKIVEGGSLRQDLVDLCRNLPFVILPLLSITLFFYFRNIYTGVLAFVVLLGTAYFIRRFMRSTETDAGASSTRQDMVDLLTNKPWLVLLGVGFLFMMFNGIKQGAIVFYFKYFFGDELLVGSYFIALLAVSTVAALATGYLTRFIEKKRLFILCLLLGGFFTFLIYWIDATQVTLLFILGCTSEFFAAIMPVLFFSMLGDSADYSEWKNGRRATGLVFSAGTFINKTGGGFAGALVLIVLASYGYDGMDAETVANSLPGMQLLMSWIPAGFAFAGAALMVCYPLTTQQTLTVEKDLAARHSSADHSPEVSSI